MGKVFLVSDTHFGHNNICNFTTDSGEKLRPWDNAPEMDEAMVEYWNETVKEGDKVYHLGDVAIAKKHLATISRLNGRKILIRGNHDTFEAKDYLQYFKDIRGVHVLSGMILSHIPIHEESLARFSINVHGHLHSRRVMKNGLIDPRYYSVCVEQIGFKPIEMNELVERIRSQGGSNELKAKQVNDCPT